MLLIVMECPLDKCGSCCILSNNSRNWKKNREEYLCPIIDSYNYSGSLMYKH